MTKAILCENSEGGVAITVVEERTINTPAGAFQVTLSGELERMAKANPENTYTVVDKEMVDKKYAESPFRGAWKTDLSTDIAKAKELLNDQRRVERDLAYKKVDGGSMFAKLNSAGTEARSLIKAHDDSWQADVKSCVTEKDLCNALGAYSSM